MYLTINQIPQSLQRPRFSCIRGKPNVYNAQKKAMDSLKWYFKKQMDAKGYLLIAEGPIRVHLTAYMPKPKTSAKKALEMEGMPAKGKVDIDNIVKFYFDVLNQIAYTDDSQIFSCLCEKYYSSKPRIEIEIKSYGDFMVNEHAKTIQENINIEDLDYMIRKANKLGESGRRICRVYSQEDAEGKHIYFETQGMKQRTNIS